MLRRLLVLAAIAVALLGIVRIRRSRRRARGGGRERGGRLRGWIGS